MPKIWQPLTSETYLQWCEAILSEASEKLNEWELAFVQDIEDKTKKKWFRITQRQAERLEQIYAAKTS